MIAATPQSTPNAAPQATDTVQVRHHDPAQQAALEALAAVLFPTATVLQATHAQPEPACGLCGDARIVGGTGPDGVEVTEACPACAAAAVVEKAVAA